MRARKQSGEDADRLRYEAIGVVFAFLRERLPQYEWGAVEVAAPDAAPHVAFGGSHLAMERFVCLAVDRRVLDCAARTPHELVQRMDLAGIDARLDATDDEEPICLELD